MKAFVLPEPEIAPYLADNLEPNVIVLSLSKALQLWYKKKKSLKVGHIEQDRVECYGTYIDNFGADTSLLWLWNNLLHDKQTCG